MQIAPPSREDVPEYRRIREELDARIGRINGRLGEPDHLPLRYINRRFWL
jgi:trehalose 6-phosphate synthase